MTNTEIPDSSEHHFDLLTFAAIQASDCNEC